MNVLLDSDLLTKEEARRLMERYELHHRFTASEILDLDLPAKNRVEALLQPEFFNDGRLRELACEFAGHTLHIFVAQVPGDYRPHECISMAFLLNTWGIGSWEQLRGTIKEARPAMRRLEGTDHVAALEACRAALLMDAEDAAEMARDVATCAQIAAHRNAWENRRSNTEPMISRECEAAWQLQEIAARLG